MRYAIMGEGTWYRGITQDDHVVFFIREAENDDDILAQLNPDKKFDLRIMHLSSGDYIHDAFQVDAVVEKVGWRM